MPNKNSKFVEVYRASHPLQAHAIKFALEEAGIPAMIENVALQDGIGDLPCGWATSPRLLVEDTQVAAAQSVIEQSDHSLQTVPQLSGKETATALAAGTLGLLGAVLVCDTADSSVSPETTRCLACNAVMAESADTCPQWRLVVRPRRWPGTLGARSLRRGMTVGGHRFYASASRWPRPN